MRYKTKDFGAVAYRDVSDLPVEVVDAKDYDKAIEYLRSLRFMLRKFGLDHVLDEHSMRLAEAAADKATVRAIDELLK